MERKTGRSQADKKNGQKWVEGNYDAKLKATAENGMTSGRMQPRIR